MIASIVWDVDPILFKVGSWEVRWYGLMWGLGFILAYEIVSRLFKKEKYPEDWVDKLFVYCIVSTVIGARLGHCLFYEWDYYSAHPVEIFKIWKGGLASHGGVFAIILALHGIQGIPHLRYAPYGLPRFMAYHRHIRFDCLLHHQKKRIQKGKRRF